MASYTIGQLATAGGVGVETVRYYQRRGLMPEPSKPLGGARRYSEADVDRLQFIKRAQGMGFALSEIASLLELRAQRSCRGTRAIAASKLQVVDARMRELGQLRTELAALIDACDTNNADAACPIIERLTTEPLSPTSRQISCVTSADTTNSEAREVEVL